MRFLVHSLQNNDLDANQKVRLYATMNKFYTDMPKGITLECDYILADRSGSYSVLEVPDRAALDAVLAPFDGLIKVEIFEVITSEEAMG